MTGPLTFTAFGCVALFFTAQVLIEPLARILELP